MFVVYVQSLRVRRSAPETKTRKGYAFPEQIREPGFRGYVRTVQCGTVINLENGFVTFFPKV